MSTNRPPIPSSITPPPTPTPASAPIPVERAERKFAAITICQPRGLQVPVRLGR